MKDYINNIESLGLYDFYYDYGSLIDKYDKYLDTEDLKNNLQDYYLIDIRENSELFNINNDYIFNHYRFPNLIKNHKKILSNIDKPILLTCIDGERGKVVSSFLGNLGYESYYLKGGLSNMDIDYGERFNGFNFCESNFTGKEIYLGIKEYENKINIPYLQLTDEDTISIINYFQDNNILEKDMGIKLICDRNKGLNCGVGRQSLGLLLNNLGYSNICLGKK